MSWVRVLQGALYKQSALAAGLKYTYRKTVTLIKSDNQAKRNKNMSTAGKKNLAEPTFMDNVSGYLKGVKAEWHKITWPERKQVITETIVVLVVVFFFTALVYAYDKIFGFLLGLLMNVK